MCSPAHPALSTPPARPAHSAGGPCRRYSRVNGCACLSTAHNQAKAGSARPAWRPRHRPCPRQLLTSSSISFLEMFHSWARPSSGPRSTTATCRPAQQGSPQHKRWTVDEVLGRDERTLPHRHPTAPFHAILSRGRSACSRVASPPRSCSEVAKKMPRVPPQTSTSTSRGAASGFCVVRTNCGRGPHTCSRRRRAQAQQSACQLNQMWCWDGCVAAVREAGLQCTMLGGPPPCTLRVCKSRQAASARFRAS